MDMRYPPQNHLQPDQTVEAPRSQRIMITPRTLWLAAAIILALLIVIVVVANALSALLLIFIALILAEGMRPLVQWLQLRAHIPRPIGVLLIYLAGIIVFVLLAMLLLSPLVAQIASLSSHTDQYARQLQDLITRLNTNSVFGQIATKVASALQNLIPTFLSVPLNFISNMLSLLFSIVVVLTLVIFWLSTTSNLKPFMLSLFPEQTQEEVASIISELSHSLGGYVRGTLFNMVAIGIFTWLGLLILGVPYALLLGILAGMTELIPYLGPWISGSVAVLVALLAVDPLKAGEVIIFFIVIQQLEGNTLQPLVMSRAVHVNPFLVLVAITIGVELLGILGAVLAVPIIAVLQVLALRVLVPIAKRASHRQAQVAAPLEAHAPVAPTITEPYEGNG